MFGHRRKDADFAAEIEAHLQIEADERRDHGVADLDAHAAARRSFGNETSARESFYESSRFMWAARLRQDAYYGVRALGRKPRFTLAAVFTLAIGVGANTAVFSALDATLMRPLPLPRPRELAAVYDFSRKTAKYVSSSYPDYKELDAHTRAFKQLSAYVRLPLNLTLDGRTERTSVEAVTANYFSMLELPAALGRIFSAEDDRASNTVFPVMISEKFWRGRFQSDPSLLGKIVAIEDHPATVIGIVPKRYRGANLNWGDPPEIWMPLSATPALMPGLRAADIMHRRNMPWLLILGRLNASSTVAEAQSEMEGISAELARAWPATDGDLTVKIFPASQSKFWPAYRESISRSFAVFGIAAALVLFLACANVSNLLIERALTRRREIAIRLSLGASRSRLIQQLMTENLLLAVPSFGAALLIALGLQHFLERFPNAFGIGLSLDLGLDLRVLLFCGLVSLLATALFGLVPALQSTRPDLITTLKESGNAVSGARHDLLRQSLTIIQVGLSMILLIGGGLFARTLFKAYSADFGFRPSNLLALSFDPRSEFTGDRGQHLVEDLRRQISLIPGVRSVTLGSNLPLSMTHYSLHIVDASNPIAVPLSLDANIVGPDFFRTVGITLIAGREFSPRDDRDATKVAIVNQTLVKRLWPNTSPIGRGILLADGPGSRIPLQIVGLVRDSKYASAWEQPEPYLYLAAGQRQSPTHLILQTAVAPASLIGTIRRRWDEIAPNIPLYEIRTGDEQLKLSLAPQRLAAGLLGAFGALAFALASIGLYSVLAYSVSQRTREIGIRLAIGAPPSTIFREVLRRSLLLSGIGLITGGAISAVFARFIASQISNVSPHDTATFVVVTLLLGAVSVAAAVGPALRAARLDPLAALKDG